MIPTLSETARHARAELETLASALRAHELARLIELARRMLDDQAERGRREAPPWDYENARVDGLPSSS
jgi:hypothetical protein